MKIIFEFIKKNILYLLIILVLYTFTAVAIQFTYSMVSYYKHLENKIKDPYYDNSLIINSYTSFTEEQIREIYNYMNSVEGYENIEYSYRVASMEGIDKGNVIGAVVSRSFLNNIENGLDKKIDYGKDNVVSAIAFGNSRQKGDTFNWKLKNGDVLKINVVENFSRETLLPEFTALNFKKPDAENIFTFAKDLVILVEDDNLKKYLPQLDEMMFRPMNLVVHFEKLDESTVKEIDEHFKPYSYTLSLTQYRKGAIDSFSENLRRVLSLPIIFFMFSFLTTVSVAILSSYKFSNDIKVLRLTGMSKYKTVFILAIQYFLISLIPFGVSIFLTYRGIKGFKENLGQAYYSSNVLIFYMIFILLIMIAVYVVTKIMITINEEGGLINDKL